MSLDFSGEIDLSDVTRFGSRLFPQPVKLSGKAENRSGIVTLSYSADFCVDTVCDRCLQAIHRPYHMKFAYTVVLSLNREDNDEFIVVPEGELDLAELATSDILLELPTLIVCKDDCRGLCPKCGANLNDGDCGCSLKEEDPRLAMLKKLLEE